MKARLLMAICLGLTWTSAAWAQLQTISGDPLRIELTDNSGRMKVFRLVGTNVVYTREYYSTFSTYLQLVNGTTTNRCMGTFTVVTNLMTNAWSINCVYDAGDTGVRVTQSMEYQNGKSYFKKQWRVSNPTATNYTDVRLLHGGDTYFANDDSSRGYWDANLNMIYLKNPNANGLMGFYGAFGSTADQYYEGDLTGLYNGLNAFNLPNTSNTNFLDAGYALQWNKSTLATGEEWIVTAYERWTGEGDVQIIPGSDMSGTVASTVTSRFTVVNFQTNSDTFNLSPLVDQEGWTANLLGGTSLTLASGESSNLAVQVTIGSATSCWVTLAAASQSNPAVTNSDSLEVTGIGVSSTGSADIAVSDMVFLPVNVTNLSPAGTVSCRLANYGPDTMSSVAVQFDFYMTPQAGGDAALIGSCQRTVSLAVNTEELIILTAAERREIIIADGLLGSYQPKVTVQHMSTLSDPNLANNTTEAAGLVRIKASGMNSPGRSLNDYDGDGKADACLYYSALGRWYAELSGDRYYADPWIGDIGVGWTPVPGDYDGDGLTDVAA